MWLRMHVRGNSVCSGNAFGAHAGVAHTIEQIPSFLEKLGIFIPTSTVIHSRIIAGQSFTPRVAYRPAAGRRGARLSSRRRRG